MAGSELDELDRRLLAVAAEFRKNAWAPISNYHVGAALAATAEDGSERICGGANVEDILLSISCCAERVALQHAVASGIRRFDRVAVITMSSPPASPCGPCRQLLHSWGVERVVMANDKGEVRTATVSELLPMAFELKGPVK